MENEDGELRERLKGKVANLLSQLDVYNLDLDKNESVEVRGLTLIAAKNKLVNSLKELKQLHTQRKEERLGLEQMEQELCAQMARQVEERPEAKSLSDPVMRELRERVSKLREDRDRLLLEFRRTRSEIIDLYNDLEEQPANAFQLRVTDSDTESFPLDADSLGRVAVLHEQLAERVQQVCIFQN
jgi:hypothetical protein